MFGSRFQCPLWVFSAVWFSKRHFWCAVCISIFVWFWQHCYCKYIVVYCLYCRPLATFASTVPIMLYSACVSIFSLDICGVKCAWIVQFVVLRCRLFFLYLVILICQEVHIGLQPFLIRFNVVKPNFVSHLLSFFVSILFLWYGIKRVRYRSTISRFCVCWSLTVK